LHKADSDSTLASVIPTLASNTGISQAHPLLRLDSCAMLIAKEQVKHLESRVQELEKALNAERLEDTEGQLICNIEYSEDDMQGVTSMNGQEESKEFKRWKQTVLTQWEKDPNSVPGGIRLLPNRDDTNLYFRLHKIFTKDRMKSQLTVITEATQPQKMKLASGAQSAVAEDIKYNTQSFVADDVRNHLVAQCRWGRKDLKEPTTTGMVTRNTSKVTPPEGIPIGPKHVPTGPKGTQTGPKRVPIGPKRR
ncbi:15782_t:CDS:2, partial [Acaulospora colombiana]